MNTVEFKMKIPVIWKRAIGIISGLVEEGLFIFDVDKVEFKAIDPAHISLIHFVLNKDAFLEYNVTEPTKIGIDMLRMNQIMGRGKNDDTFKLLFDKDTNRLTVKFQSNVERSFTLPIIDMDEKELPEPELKLTAEINLHGDVFKDGIDDANLIGSDVSLKITDGGIELSSDSDRGSTNLVLDKGESGLVFNKFEAPAEGKYSVNYLQKIMSGIRTKESLKIRLGNQLPIVINYDIASGKGKLQFLLAPKIERDE